jgi:hypothetical protein
MGAATRGNSPTVAFKILHRPAHVCGLRYSDPEARLSNCPRVSQDIPYRKSQEVLCDALSFVRLWQSFW